MNLQTLGFGGKVATTLQLGATKKKNLMVNYIILNMAKLMLANIAPDDELTRTVHKAANETKRKLQASHTPAELQPIQIMNDSALAMVRVLVKAESVDGLNLVRHYMDELAAGRVLIMEKEMDIDTDALTNPEQ